MKNVDTSQISIRDQKIENKPFDPKTAFNNDLVITQGKLHYSNGFYYIG